jgi:hypothetical protein
VRASAPSRLRGSRAALSTAGSPRPPRQGSGGRARQGDAGGRLVDVPRSLVLHTKCSRSPDRTPDDAAEPQVASKRIAEEGGDSRANAWVLHGCWSFVRGASRGSKAIEGQRSCTSDQAWRLARRPASSVGPGPVACPNDQGVRVVARIGASGLPSSAGARRRVDVGDPGHGRRQPRRRPAFKGPGSRGCRGLDRPLDPRAGDSRRRQTHAPGI